MNGGSIYRKSTDKASTARDARKMPLINSCAERKIKVAADFADKREIAEKNVCRKFA